MKLIRPYYVEHIGRRFCTNAADFPTLEDAASEARRTCAEAIETRVWDCTAGPVGRLVLRLSPTGCELPA